MSEPLCAPLRVTPACEAAKEEEGQGQPACSPLPCLQVLSSWTCQRNPWPGWPASCWTGLSSRGRSSLRTEKICSGSCCSNTGAPACQALDSTPTGPISPARLPQALPGGPGGPSLPSWVPLFFHNVSCFQHVSSGNHVSMLRFGGHWSPGGWTLKVPLSIHSSGSTYSFQTEATRFHPQCPSEEADSPSALGLSSLVTGKSHVPPTTGLHSADSPG